LFSWARASRCDLHHTSPAPGGGMNCQRQVGQAKLESLAVVEAHRVFLTCGVSPRNLSAGPGEGGREARARTSGQRVAAKPRPPAGSRYSAAAEMGGIAGMGGIAEMAIGESPSVPGRRVSGVAMVGSFPSADDYTRPPHARRGLDGTRDDDALPLITKTCSRPQTFTAGATQLKITLPAWPGTEDRLLLRRLHRWHHQPRGRRCGCRVHAAGTTWLRHPRRIRRANGGGGRGSGATAATAITPRTPGPEGGPWPGQTRGKVVTSDVEARKDRPRPTRPTRPPARRVRTVRRAPP
jgi:hypothetical protein